MKCCLIYEQMLWLQYLFFLSKTLPSKKSMELLLTFLEDMGLIRVLILNLNFCVLKTCLGSETFDTFLGTQRKTKHQKNPLEPKALSIMLWVI